MSCTTTPPQSPSTAFMPMPLRKKSGAKRRGWPSPGATTKTIGPTSSNCFTSSRCLVWRDPLVFPGRQRQCGGRPTHCATWDLLCRLTGRRDFLYVADCSSPAPIHPCINSKAGSSPCCPGLEPRTASSGTCCPKVRSSVLTSTTSGMTRARSLILTLSACLPLLSFNLISFSGITARVRRNMMPARGISKSSSRLSSWRNYARSCRLHGRAITRQPRSRRQSRVSSRPGASSVVLSRRSRSLPRRSIVRTVAVAPMPRHGM